MNTPIYCNSIGISIPNESIYKRLGMPVSSEGISMPPNKSIDAIIRRAMACCQLQGAFARLPVTQRTKETVCIGDDWCIESEKLSFFLKNSHAAILLAATAGNQVMEMISHLTDSEKMGDVVVFDAVGSESADYALQHIHRHISKQVLMHGECITSARFSPGYGDLSLHVQKDIHTILQLKTLGIDITDTYILQPEKSVIAIAGIESITDTANASLLPVPGTDNNRQ